MRKVIFILIIFFLTYNTLYAQNTMRNTYKDQPKTIGTFGLNVHALIPTSYDTGKAINYGGGTGFALKINYFEYVALLLDFNYSYSQTSIMNTHLYDIGFHTLIQHEKAYNGFVPWVGFGIGLNPSKYSSKNYALDGTFNMSLVLSAGLRYNYKQFYFGPKISYSFYLFKDDINHRNTYNEYYEGLDATNLKIYFEAGYRF